MKKILILLVLGALLLSSGCFRYGNGKSFGYITTVEDGIVWNHAYFRAELESSNTDCYLYDNEDVELEHALLEASNNKQRVEISFNRHLITISNCANDVITRIKNIK